MQGKELLGYTAEDRITKFKGVVTGFVQYISGCSQCLLVPPVGEDGKIREGQWFDEQRLLLHPAVDPIVLNNAATPGADNTPKSRAY